VSVDGGTIAVVTRTVPSTGSIVTAVNMHIGRYSGSATQYMDGSLGPLVIYDSPLTAAELARLTVLGANANFDSIKRIA
jgi:hypothetical protein